MHLLWLWIGTDVCEITSEATVGLPSPALDIINQSSVMNARGQPVSNRVNNFHPAQRLIFERMSASCIQLIDGTGAFQSLDEFASRTRLNDKGPGGYQIVAIMGPQSSGKSTLMNHVVSV